MTKPLYVVDFFCGAGGMTEGLRQASLRVVAGVDNDPGVEKTYLANHPTAMFKCVDIRDCKGADVLSWLPEGASKEDLVMVGCSPCQYWSKVRSDKTESESGSTLLLEFGRLVKEVEPGYVVVENVPGIAKQGMKAVLKPFMATLKSLHMEPEWEFAWGTEFGVPQRRERFLLIASRHHKSVKIPNPKIEEAPRVREFIGDPELFPPLAAGEQSPEDRWHRAAHLSEENLKRIKMTPPDGGDRSAWKDTELQIPAYEKKDNHFANVYSRMWWDQPAPTLTTRFNSLSNGRFGHPEQHRAITVREGATLQTFPRHYQFEGSMAHVCKQIGNAVPPLIAKTIGEYLVDLQASRECDG